MIDADQPMFIKNDGVTYSTFMSAPKLTLEEKMVIEIERKLRLELEKLKNEGSSPKLSNKTKTDYSPIEQEMLKKAEEERNTRLKAETTINTQYLQSFFTKFVREPDNQVEVTIGGKLFKTKVGPEDIVTQIMNSFEHGQPEISDQDASVLSHLIHKAIERPCDPGKLPQLEWVKFIVPIERALAEHTIKNMEKEGDFPFLHPTANAKYIQAKKMMGIISLNGGKNPIFEYINYHSKQLSDVMQKPYVNELAKSTPGFNNRAEIAVGRWSDLSIQAQK